MIFLRQYFHKELLYLHPNRHTQQSTTTADLDKTRAEVARLSADKENWQKGRK